MQIPTFLKELLNKQYGEEQTARIEEGFAARRPVTLRANPLRSSKQQVEQALSMAGIGYRQVPWYDDALIIEQARESEIAALEVYAGGGVYMQSLSSMLPPLVLQPGKGDAVLDMAAAPGGKTTQMAALTGNGAGITACEKNKIRADRLRYNLDRQGARSVLVMQTDARQLDELFRFDKVLLDAPCSGSGTLQTWRDQLRFEPTLVERSVKSQRALLAKALKVLKVGGEMVYSTCSILQQENEDIVKEALKPGKVELIPIDAEAFGDLPLLPTTLPGTVCICPDPLFEGFFVAKLRRVK